MTSKISRILTDKKNHKDSQVINQNILELWNGYKKFKTKFHAHNAKLERFTLKVLKLSFFNNQSLENCNKDRHNRKCQNSCKINAKSQLVLIKKAISIHLRSLLIEQRLYQENQYLKELLNNCYKISIQEKYRSNIEVIKIKNLKIQEKCFKSGLEYILHELEDVSNQTKLKTKRILDAGSANDAIPLQSINGCTQLGNSKGLLLSRQENASKTSLNAGKKLEVIAEVTDSTAIDEDKSLPRNFDLQIDLKPLNSDISKAVHNNLQSIFDYIANHSLNKLVFDVEPVSGETNLLDIKDTSNQKQIFQKAVIECAKVRSSENERVIAIDIRENIDAKSLKKINTLIPNKFIRNYIELFFPLSFLFGKGIRYQGFPVKKKFDNCILQKDVAFIDFQRASNNNYAFDPEKKVSENVCLTSTETEEEKKVSKEETEDCINLSEIKTVEFYDIPSNTDIHDYTVSWIEQQNERDFYYIKPEKMDNFTNNNDQPKKRKSIMKRSAYSAPQDFKDYLKNIITYSEEFYDKKNSNSRIIPKKEKKRKIINFPTSNFTENNFAGKIKTKNILEQNKSYNSYKPSKMPDMNKTYQIVFQQNMPQGFSLKFVKTTEKDVSTLIVSNRYPINKQCIPKIKFYKK